MYVCVSAGKPEAMVSLGNIRAVPESKENIKTDFFIVSPRDKVRTEARSGQTGRKRRGYTYKDTKKGYPPATEKGRQGQTSKSTPVEYQDTLILEKSQLLMKVQIFLSTNDGAT